MTPADRIRVRTLFDEVLDADRESRADTLARLCPREDIRAEVLSLLAAFDEATELEPLGWMGDLGQEWKPVPSASGLVGRRIGPYRVAEEIGRGGMGVVYRAVRDDGRFDRVVAIKVIGAGMHSGAIVRRFEAEQRILAALDHPNITKLLDGGQTEGGVTYFVMEYVVGRQIDVYCDENGLDIDGRLRLFLDVCDAVRYAHTRLVVHRDLKPGNILVAEDGDGRPIPKLLDFGIAKLLQPQLGPTGMLTTVGHRPLTPAYASPEQLRGEPASTAYDVYALGVVLYRLLTGRLPFEPHQCTSEELRRVVLETNPAKPSSVVLKNEILKREDGSTETITPEAVSRARGTTPELLRRRFAGDLDTIVLTALRKETERRYGSVEQLGDDIRRYLSGRPISAYPDSLRYRGAKFVRRHQKSVVAATLILLSLVGGVLATIWQAQIADRERIRAERRFADVRHLAGSFLFEFHDAIHDLPGSTRARELVVRRGLEYLDKLAQESGKDPALRLELAAAYRRIGDVQGNPTNANLGRTQEALASYRKALSILKGVSLSRADVLESTAVTSEKMADVQSTLGDLEGAHRSLSEAISTYRELVEQRPRDVEAQIRHVVGLIKLGDLQGNPNLPNRGHPSSSLEQYLAARPMLKALHSANPAHDRIFRLLGVLGERLGTIYVVLGDFAAAEDSFTESLKVREQYAKRRPNDLDGIRDLAIAHEKMGLIASAAGDLQEARRRHLNATKIFEDLSRADSSNVQARQSVAISFLHQGDLAGHPDYRNLGDRESARSYYTHALNLLADISRSDPANTRNRELAARAQEKLEALASHPSAHTED